VEKDNTMQITLHDKKSEDDMGCEYEIQVRGEIEKGVIGRIAAKGFYHDILIGIAYDRLFWMQQNNVLTKHQAKAFPHIEDAMLWLKQDAIERGDAKIVATA
jgi:hypothetical protein